MTVHNFFVVIFFLLIGVPFPCEAQDGIEKRVALVIGIQNYVSVPALRNSLMDAKDMSAVLKGKGFEVIEVYDPINKKELQAGIRKYFTIVTGQKNLAGLVYYSGHGVQVDGTNYLVPVSADLQFKADLEDQCVNMNFVMDALAEAGNPLNILILDACRNNPFKGFSRGTEKGLNMVDAPKGSYIVYSTKPGSVASDGTGKNGLFTSKLLKYINEGGLNIEQVFKKVAKDVSAESSEAQRPWISSDYTGDFYFNVGDSQSGTPTPNSIASNDPASTVPSNTRAVEEGNENSKIKETLSSEEMLKNGEQFMLAKNYRLGSFWLEKAANAGNINAQLKLGAFYESDNPVGKDYKKSFSWYKLAADQGSDLGETKLGFFLEDGYGVEENDEEAVNWYRRAAEKNNVEAQHNLAIMYLKGRGIPKDELQAIFWLQKAAEKGMVKAQNSLGNIYLMGEGKVPQKKSEAVKWFRLAAAQGDEWAKETLNTLGYK